MVCLNLREVRNPHVGKISMLVSGVGAVQSYTAGFVRASLARVYIALGQQCIL